MASEVSAELSERELSRIGVLFPTLRIDSVLQHHPTTPPRLHPLHHAPLPHTLRQLPRTQKLQQHRQTRQLPRSRALPPIHIIRIPRASSRQSILCENLLDLMLAHAVEIFYGSWHGEA